MAIVSDALKFMLDLCSSLSLIPYFLAAAYALELALPARAAPAAATSGVTGPWTGRIAL
jgi:arginine:ornithine antiporter/lysine permease